MKQMIHPILGLASPGVGCYHKRKGAAAPKMLKETVGLKRWTALALAAAMMMTGLPAHGEDTKDAMAATAAEATPDEAMPVQIDAPAMDAQVDDAFRDVKTIGGAFVIAHRGEIVYERYYGFRHKAKRRFVTEDTYFRCASVSKLVTGMGILRLCEQGVLDIDEDISTYLGYTVRNPRYMDVPITLRMLMSHTSSINENASFNFMSSRLRDMLDVDRKAMANFRSARPGSDYTYSNFGAGVTGSVIEAATGKDVCTAMRETLFDPLGIDAAYHATQLKNPDDIAAIYKTDGTLYTAPSYLLRQRYTAECLPDAHYRLTAGGLWIRPRDLARLGIALCGDGSVDGVRVIGEESIAMTREPNSEETTGITAESPYSCFCITRGNVIEGRTVYGHQGTDEGIVCNLYVEPESELVICVMINGCRARRVDGVMSVSRRLAQLAWDAICEDGTEP